MRIQRVFKFAILASIFVLLVSTGCASADLEPITPRPIARDARPVIIDTDMAADDWLAILYLLSDPEIDVKAITVTGAGEAHCGPGTRNALDLAALAGRPDIPVSCGLEKPLKVSHTFPTEWREQVDALHGLKLPENNSEVSRKSAVEMLTGIINASPAKIHLLVLGPLTNVAQALEADPALIQNLEMITVMGGAVRVPGNVGPSSDIDNEVAEWNIYADPHAASAVFQAGAPVTLVPLDATNHVPLTMDFYRQLKGNRGNDVAEFVYQVLTEKEEDLKSGWYFFWDPLAAAVVTDEELAVFEEIELVVIDREGPQSGQTLESETGATIRVAISADPGRFEGEFLETINGLNP